MASIGFVIENISCNWSIITHRDSNKKSIRDFIVYSVKLINKKANRIFDRKPKVVENSITFLAFCRKFDSFLTNFIKRVTLYQKRQKHQKKK